jgi:predicted nucleic acid-binding protein
LSGWLIDTNVLSELRRLRPEKKVLAFIAARPLESLFVSIVTLAEIRFGIALVDDPTKGLMLDHWLTHGVRPMFVNRVLGVDENIVLKWRLLIEAGRKQRHTYSNTDVFIAATALHHGLTVVTRDTREFERAGAPVLNPWR